MRPFTLSLSISVLLLFVTNGFKKSSLFRLRSNFDSNHFKVSIEDEILTEIPRNNLPTQKMPVTVLSGFLGAGKTTLLTHILKSGRNDRRYAVIVNDMSEIVTKLAKSGLYEHLIIEGTGIAEPLPIAETFTFPADNITTESLLDLAEIKNMVTVVDSANFVRDLQEAEDLKSRGLHASEDDTRTITDLMVSQVEFASIIIMNKCDLVTPTQLLRVKQAIRALNAEAKIIETIRCAVDVEKDIIGAETFDIDKASQSATWIKAMNTPAEEKNKPETEEYGISSYIYRARRPFHPLRLMDFIEQELDLSTDDGETHKMRVLRSKGFFWLASRPSQCLVWSQAGGLFQITPGYIWWADADKDDWPQADAEEEQERDAREQLNSDWQEPFGDRRQEIVFIGTDMDTTSLTRKLNKCLLTDKELAKQKEGDDGRISWGDFEDPFPATPEGHSHDHDHEYEEEEDDEANAITMVIGSSSNH